MKAARVHVLGEAPRIDEVEAPLAAKGRTVIEMQAATVGHTDRAVWSGNLLVTGRGRAVRVPPG